MDKFKIGLLVVVGALLLIQIIDRSREPQQMLELKKSIDELTSTLQRNPGAHPATATTAVDSPELKQAIAQLTAAVKDLGTRPITTAPPTGTGEKPPATPDTGVKPPTADGARDGNPKIGVNFLLPYDRSHFHPEWVRGTLKSFNTTPKGLNPLTDNSAITGSVHTLCNDSLCDRPPATPEQWAESLAESVIISDDYKTYTFKLRKGVKWQRPTIAKRPEFSWLDKDIELTADDFKFMLDMILDPAVDCPSLRNYYEDFDKAEVVDPYTLRLTWKRTVYTSLSFSLGLSPLPRHVYGNNSDGTPTPVASRGAAFNKHWFDAERCVIGVGAYLLTEFSPDKVMRFRRNPAYWGAPLHFNELEWNLEVKQDDPQLIAFKNGQVHAEGLSPLKYKSEILDHHEPRFAALDPGDPKAGRAGELGWERVKTMSFTYLGWNLRKPPFNDKFVRQAMSHAFPKDRVIKDIFYGLGQPVLSDVLLDSQYLNKELKPYAFDLAKAAALLKEAGWSDSNGDGLLDKQIDGKLVSLSFIIKYIANSPEWDNTLLVYKNELRKIGVEMTPKPYEWKELMRVFEDKDFDAVVSGWQMDWDIDYFQLWHSSQVDVQGSSNHCGFANKRVDELADKLRTTFSTPERVAIAKEIQAIIHEEQPYTFFKSGEGIFIWQNHAPADATGAPQKDRYLDGVIYGLDHLPPLTNRNHMYWHFRD